MQTILIKLDAGKLENPDLDIRYLVPERIEAATEGVIRDNGYDYLDEAGKELGLWLQTESASDQYHKVVELLKRELFSGNDLSGTAEVLISEEDCAEAKDCRRVYPE